MSGGPWRITVDSWVTDKADWYGRRTFVIDGANSLPEALRMLSEVPAEVYLDQDRLKIRRGKAPKVDVPKRGRK